MSNSEQRPDVWGEPDVKDQKQKLRLFTGDIALASLAVGGTTFMGVLAGGSLISGEVSESIYHKAEIGLAAGIIATAGLGMAWRYISNRLRTSRVEKIARVSMENFDERMQDFLSPEYVVRQDDIEAA